MSNVHIVGVSTSPTILISPIRSDKFDPPDLFTAKIEFDTQPSDPAGTEKESCHVLFMVPGAYTHPSVVQFFPELKEALYRWMCGAAALKTSRLWIRDSTLMSPPHQTVVYADSVSKRFYHKDWSKETEPPKPISQPVKKELVISRPLLVAQETAKRDIDLSVRLDEMNDQKQIPFTLVLKDRLLPVIQVVYTGLLGFLADVGMKTLTVTDIDLTNAPAYSEVLGLEQLMMPPSYFFSRSECDAIWAKWGAGETNICPYVYSVSESVYALLPKYVVDTEMADGTYELNNRWMWGLWQSLIDRINLHVVSISNRLIIGTPMEMLEKPVAAKRVLELSGYLGTLNDQLQSPFEIMLVDRIYPKHRIGFKGYIADAGTTQPKQLRLTEIDVSEVGGLIDLLDIQQVFYIPALLIELCPSNLHYLETGKSLSVLSEAKVPHHAQWVYGVHEKVRETLQVDAPEVMFDTKTEPSSQQLLGLFRQSFADAGIEIHISA